MLPLPSISTKPQPSVISSGSMDISTTSPSAPSGNPLILPSINDSPGSDISDVEMDQSPPEPETNITASSSRSPPLNSAEQDVVQQEASSSSVDAQEDEEDPYSIRLTPFIDHSSTTPALYINSVERKAHDGLVIRVGRYTEKKESPPPKPEHAPIVFKSKVVSRSHAQLNVKDGQWFVQDVKSSSGTFLNHVRLSPACQQSQPYALKDGDILQLGMDFRGGSEEIYKCIKVRVEVNRSWQKRVNNFNVNALSNLRNICSLNTKELQECAICLLPVAPCQALFIAPCTHAWHYKCIRPLVIKSYPHFLCPNCRAMCDLEAEIETPDLSHLQQIAAEAESSANTS